MNSGAKAHQSVACVRRGKLLMSWLMLFLLLDVCTTVFGLSVGFRELNPLLASWMHASGIGGLFLYKALALVLAGYFLYSGRLALLRRVTVLMGLVVGWNLFWLVTR